MAHSVFFGLKYEFTVFYESTHRMNTISPFLDTNCLYSISHKEHKNKDDSKEKWMRALRVDRMNMNTERK